jgi:hypothetical protein
MFPPGSEGEMSDATYSRNDKRGLSDVRTISEEAL